LLDNFDAVSAIERHVERGPLTDGLVSTLSGPG
jgi:hypothetical protein